MISFIMKIMVYKTYLNQSNSLKNMGIKAEQVAKWLELAGVDGKRRAETLSLEDFAKLTNSFNEAVK